MTDFLIGLLQGIPFELATVILAMLPITELRASVPVAITVFDLPVWSALVFSYIGNVIPVFFLLWLLPSVVSFAEKHIPSLHRFLNHYFDRIHRKHREKYERYGTLAIFLLVAVPLPLTGVWTASALAVLVRLPKRKSFPAIVLGMITAGILVALIVRGVIGFLGFLV